MTARREEILQTATELFGEHGFSDAVTQVLADRLKIGKGTIYRHFPSKRELFLAAADRVMVKLNERIECSIAGIDDGLESITVAITAYLAFFAENPHFVELIIQERAGFKDRKRPTYFEHRERNVQRWRQLYRDLIAEGRIRDMSVGANLRCRQRSDLRHHVHELFHRSVEAVGRASTRNCGHCLSWDPERFRTTAA